MTKFRSLDQNVMLPSASTQRSSRFLIRVATAIMDKGVDKKFLASKGFDVSNNE